MADDKDPLPVPAQRQVAEEAADARNGLPPAFPARVGPVQVLALAACRSATGIPLRCP